MFIINTKNNYLPTDHDGRTIFWSRMKVSFKLQDIILYNISGGNLNDIISYIKRVIGYTLSNTLHRPLNAPKCFLLPTIFLSTTSTQGNQI